MNFYGISNILAAITNTAIALFVFFKGNGTKLSRIWSIFTLSVAIYALGAYMATSSNNVGVAFAWWRFSYMGVILLPVLFMHFVYTFLGIERSKALIWVYGLTFIIWVSNIVSKELFIGNVTLLFTGSKHFAQAWWVYPPGPLHVFFVIFLYIGLLSFLLVKLIRAYSRVKGIKKKQIGYFFVAMTFGFLGGGTSYLPCFGIELYPVFNLTVPLYTFIIAYAIIRHNLMDIKIIIKKTIVFGGLFVISYAIFAGFGYLVMLFFEQLGQNRWLAMIPSIFFIVLVLRPLDRTLRRITDKYLFQRKYDYKHLLRTFTDEVITVLDLSELLNLTVSKLTDIMRLENASILLFDEPSSCYKGEGLFDGVPEKKCVSADDGAVSYLERTGGCLLKNDPGIRHSLLTETIDSLLAKINAELVVPISTTGNMIGILALGPQKSDEMFSENDIDILFPLAKTLAIAITNARLFEQLSQAQAQAAQREKMAVIGTLSAGINHEICNPLGISRGQCEMFLLNLKEGFYDEKTPEELLEKAKDIMGKVIRETDRATVITRKLSSFAKPARGDVEENVNINDELKAILVLLEHDMNLENIVVIKEFEDGLPGIMADPKQLQEIFFNIIRNAAQAVGSGGRVTIKTSVDRNEVHVQITDTGSGISKKHIDKIFDPFFTTKDPGKGTGLGLFIVRQIVEKNRGHIKVESKEGKGTVFSLRFSISQKPSSASSNAERVRCNDGA